MSFSIKESVCNGCDACKTACPTQAIYGEQHEVHKIDPDLCVSCGLCLSFCTNFGIRSGENHDDMTEAEDFKIPNINTSLCTGCSACVRECPMYVLSVSAPKFKGDIHTFAYITDQDNCIGCGKCEEHCPVGAIEMVDRL